MPNEDGKPVNPENKIDLSDLDSLSRDELRWAADRSLLTPSQIQQYKLDRPHDPSAPKLPEEYKGDVDTAQYHGVSSPSGPQINAVGSDSDALRGGNDDDLPDEVESYEELTVPQLKKVIDQRNEGRSAEDKLSKSGDKGELVARLEEDDERSEG